MHYRLGDLEIDLAEHSVLRDGRPLDVRGLSFELLVYLVQQGTRVVGFEELITAVWSPAIVNEETVTQRVRLLRTALGDDGRKPRYVRSVRGKGYGLCLEPVAVDFETGRRGRLRTLMLAVAGFGAIGVAVVVALAVHGEESSPRPVTDQGGLARVLERADYYAGIGQVENNVRALALYRQVLASDPDNRSARLGLSFSLSASTCQFDASPSAASEAGELAAMVLAEDSSNARAHAALAYSYDCRGLIDKAIASYERAVALDPDGRRDCAASAAHLYAVKGRLADALRLNVHALPDRDELRFVGLQLANVLDLLGFHVAAEQRYAEEFRLYPDNVFSNAAYPAYLFSHGRLSDAKAVLQEAMPRPARPELLVLAGEIHLMDGERELARQRFAEAAALREHMGLPGTLASLYDETSPGSSWFAAQVERVRAAIDAGDRWPDNWLELALLEWHRNDEAAAVRALHEAVDNGYRNAAYLRVSPLFSALRERPQFAAVLDRIVSETTREREAVLAAEWLPGPLLSVRR